MSQTSEEQIEDLKQQLSRERQKRMEMHASLLGEILILRNEMKSFSAILRCMAGLDIKEKDK